MPDLKMPMIATVIIDGRLYADATKDDTAFGAKVKFRMAHDHGFGDKKKTDSYTVEVWGKSGDSLLPRLTKGTPVLVQGSLIIEEWETKDGQKRQAVKISADRVQTLSWPDGDADTPRSASAPSGATQSASRRNEPIPEDDIPF